jgi:hypothetical protein
MTQFLVFEGARIRSANPPRLPDFDAGKAGAASAPAGLT